MQKTDLPELQVRLEELADALGGRAVGAKGIMVWLDALREVRFDDVKAALTDWPKSHTKMPSPAEILKACRESSSARREADAAIRRAQERESSGIEGAIAGAKSPAGREALRAIRELLSDCKPGLVAGTVHHIGGRPDMDMKGWARKLKAREEAGEQLDVQQRRMWREALG